MVVSSLFVSRGPDPTGWMTSIAAYFLFVALTGMRFSPRLCIFMGVFAAIQFLLINELAQSIGGQGLPVPQRLATAVLLIATGLMLAASAHNARRLVVRVGLAERERAHFEGVAELTKRLAITDELTGLHNRRHFYDEFQRDLMRAERHGRPLAVLVIDVDRFKDINDILGHQVGDEILRQIASVLRQLTRSSDVVARIGGDELGILLYEADTPQARALAERLCEAVRNHSYEAIGKHAEVQPTLSIGLACFPADGRDVKTLLASADNALYLAKDLGKDRVEYLAGHPS